MLQLRGGTDSSYIAGDGVATSMILSASWAKLLKLPASGVEARTICTFGSKCCRKSLYRKALSVFRALSPIAVAFFSKSVTVSYPPAPRCGTVVVSDSGPRQQYV